MKGTPRLWAVRHHPPVPCLRQCPYTKAPLRHATWSTGAPRSPIFFVFFFFFSSSVSGCRGQREAIIFFFGTKTTSFWTFLKMVKMMSFWPFLFLFFKRPKRHRFGACYFKIKNRPKGRHFGLVFPFTLLFWLFSTRQPSQILP